MTEPYKRSYPDKLSYMNTLKKNKKKQLESSMFVMQQ